MKRKYVSLMVVLIVVMFCNGCASYMSHQSSKKEIATERIIASGNTEAQRAMRLGMPADKALRVIPIDGGRGAIVAVDVTSMDAIAKHPFRAAGAAIVDVGTTYLLYEGAKYLGGDPSIFGNGDGDRNSANNDIIVNDSTDVIIIIDSDGNIIDNSTTMNP